MSQRILIMGLPGSGKTYFAERLKTYLETHGTIQNIDPSRIMAMENWPGDPAVEVDWFNADEIRRRFNDWDFSRDGRIRQSLRMFEFALKSSGDYVICDFVAPLPEMRANYKADWTIWIDTIDAGRYEDTNQAFVPPEVYDFRITEQNAERWVEFVGDHILDNRRRPRFNWQQETVQMLGRWQPWHQGHRALFERAIAKTGQVCIMIRDCQGWQGSNPFAINQVKTRIQKDLDPLYQGQYEIVVVPNIVNITYGRDVGYLIEQETFDAGIEAISATNIRQQLNLP
jgi:adenylylsulfate kinase